MKKKISIIFFAMGIIFIVNAVLGRYIVLPGYLQSLENGSSENGGMPDNVNTWHIVRYLLWAYSYKLGIYFITISALIRTNISKLKLGMYSLAGFIYIGFAYMPLSMPKIVYGIAGAIMTVFIVYIIYKVANERGENICGNANNSDFRIGGYFFFAMATYNLCPLLGVKAFALQPEKMMKYGLQSDAQTFALHILIELLLGWILIGISYAKRNKSMVE